MDYKKTTWKTGDVISETKLNKIETVIEDIADEITKMQNLHVCYKSPADFGATSAEDIGTMISMMNGYSTVKFWINNSDSYPLIYNFVYDGITADINPIYHAYGIVTIEVTGNCARIIFEPYDATDRYEINYSSVNDSGWGKWVKYASTTERVIIQISDFFTSINTTVVDSTIYRIGNHIYGHIRCSGSANTNGEGSFAIGRINEAYRPILRQLQGVHFNSDTNTGNVYTPGTLAIHSTGWCGVYTGKVNSTIGNSTYPWCCSEGLGFDYEL